MATRGGVSPPSTTPPRFRRPSAITAMFAVLTVAALVVAVVATGSPATTQTARERMVTATRGVVQTTVSGSGSLQPSKQLDLSFGASGAVTHVYVKAGDRVVQGQVLARIDPSSAEADLAQAKADLQTAEDTLTKAESSGSSTTTAAATTSAVYSYASATDTTTTPTDTTPAPTPTTPTTTTPTTTTPAPTTTTPKPTTTTPKQTTTAPKQTAAPQSSGGSGGGGSGGGGSSGGASSGASSGGSTGGTVSLAAAQANVESAKLTVTKAEKALTATKLIAPSSGTIAAVNGVVGDNITAGSSGSSGSSGGSSSGSTPSVAGGLGASSSSSPSSSSTPSSTSGFITLVNVHRFTMDVSLSESDIGSVKLGQAATVTVNAASGQQYAAHVTAIGVLPSSSGSSSAVSYPVTLLLDQSSSSLKAGMSATADIVTAETSGITIPTQALTGSTVTVDQNGKRTSRTVTTGLTGDSTTQIVSGLSAGDQVVVRSAVVTPSATSAAGQQPGGLGGGGLARPGGGFGGGGFGGGGGRSPGSFGGSSSRGRRGGGGRF
jgi:multidrug efflux pump subunit AcrA (membrane-fusion protein)